MQLKKGNFMDSQGKQIRTENRSLFKLKLGNNGHICVAVAVAVLVAIGPFCQHHWNNRKGLGWGLG